MKKLLLLANLLIICVFTMAQNVGIGTNTPQHPLDVAGDINLTGQMLVNGTAGQANQVLTSTGNGTMTWTSTGQYANHETIAAIGTTNWTVPAGVTKIMVELWGGGGGGSCAGGGGGGGYLAGFITVVPGASIALTVGTGGSGLECGSTSNSNGNNSVLSTATITLSALGGQGSYSYSSSGSFLGRGGNYSVSSSINFRNWINVPGEDGTPNEIRFVQPSSGVTWELTRPGTGGNAGNTSNTGSKGGYTHFILNTGTMVKYVTGGIAKRPGGGGNGNVDRGAIYSGGSGASGLIRIHY